MPRTTYPHSPSSKSKLKSFWAGLWSSVTSSLSSNGICTTNQCPIGNLHPTGSTEPLFNNVAMSTSVSETSTNDFYDMVVMPAKKGFSYSFLCAFVEEMVSDHLAKHHYNKKQIEWINQFITTFILFTLSGSSTTLAIPAMNFLLEKFGGFNKTEAPFISLGILVALEVITAPAYVMKLPSILSVAFLSSLVGRKTGELSYAAGTYLLNNMFRANSILKIAEEAPAPSHFRPR